MGRHLSRLTIGVLLALSLTVAGCSDDEVAGTNGGNGVAPSADFTGSPTSGAAPLTVDFTDQSTGNPAIWTWTFGDNGTSTDQNPSYTYNSAGIYSVSLTATNSDGRDYVVKADYVTVSGGGGPTPVVDYVYPRGVHPGYTVTIEGSNFGATRGNSVVTFGGEDATQYGPWRDTEIKVVMPGQPVTFMTSVNVTVTVGGKQSTAVALYKTSPDVVLITPEGDDMTQPCWLSDEIYFTRYTTQGAELTANIYHMSSGGGHMTQRTFYSGITDFPSATVPTLAFRSNHEGQFDIYTSTGTGNQAHVTRTPAKDFEVAMTPSGAGGTLALSMADSLHGGIVWNIWQLSTSLSQVTYGNKDFHPTWSNMGNYIAFQRTHSEWDGAQIMVIPRWGGTEVEVTPYGESCTAPAWNQAYDVIAFQRGAHIYCRKPDGTDERQLTFNPIYSASLPAWSAGGRELAWVDFLNGHYVVFVADVHDILVAP